MTESKIDKKIKNARLAVDRALSAERKARAQKELERLEHQKQQMKRSRV